MGFYAAFMVADEVEVYSHSATDDATYCWSSKGMGEYEITKSSTLHRGTTIVLHLKEDQKKFAIEQTIIGVTDTFLEWCRGQMEWPVDMLVRVQYDTVPAFMQAQQKLPPRLWRAHRDV